MSTKIHIFHSIKSSLTRKIVLVSLLATLLPILLGGVFFYSYSMRNIEREYMDSVSNNLRQLNYNIISQVNACRQTALSFAGDTKLLEFLQYGDDDDYFMVDNMNNYIYPRLRNTMLYNANFYSVRLIHGNDRIPNSYKYLYYDSRFKDSWWKNYIKTLSGKSKNNKIDYYFNVLHKENDYLDSDDESQDNVQVFSLFYPIYGTYNLEIIGVFEISIEDNMFLKSLKESNTDIDKGIVINLMTSDNKIVYNSSDKFKGLNASNINNTSNAAIVKINNMEYFINKSYIPDIDSWIVQYTPKEVIYKNSTFGWLIVFGLLVVFVTIASLSFMVFKLLLANLNKLTRTIHLVKQGDLKARVDVNSNDEVGELGREFNEMTEKVCELLKKVEDSGKAEKEAIYKSLENQISPHFICNALDAIRMTAETQNNRQIADATELISSYFMYNIYIRSKDVTLAEELKNVTDYLDIHNLIRRDKIEYLFKISSDIRGYLERYHIIKFCLQPIIENSIKHGFKRKYDNYLIILDVTYHNGTIKISIEDNGVGINEEDLIRINDSLDLKKEDHKQKNTRRDASGIGLRNIKERLDINYNSQYTFEIVGYEGVGTKIVIEIPAY